MTYKVYLQNKKTHCRAFSLLLRFTHKVKADMIENKNKIEKNGDLIYFEIRKYAFPTFEISKFQINIFKTEISNQLIFARGEYFMRFAKASLSQIILAENQFLNLSRILSRHYYSENYVPQVSLFSANVVANKSWFPVIFFPTLI